MHTENPCAKTASTLDYRRILDFSNKCYSNQFTWTNCISYFFQAVNAAIYLLGSILYKPSGDATYDRHLNSVSRSVSTNLDPSSKRSTVVSEQPKNNGVVEMEASLPGEIKLPETQQFFENTAYEDEKNNWASVIYVVGRRFAFLSAYTVWASEGFFPKNEAKIFLQKWANNGKISFYQLRN